MKIVLFIIDGLEKKVIAIGLNTNKNKNLLGLVDVSINQFTAFLKLLYKTSGHA
jgi:hypothetical protein